MDLGRAIKKFAKNEIFGWNPARRAFESTGVFGSLQVYDRFISDRTFGTKKRLLLTPYLEFIPAEYEYIRLGDSVAKFMVDALNEDVFANSSYANVYLVRECRYLVEIGHLEGTGKASGSGGKKTFTVESSVFGDYERYTANNSKGFDTVDYTVSDVFLPLSVDIDSTKLLRVDGKLYDVTEVSRVSNLLWVRAQKVGEDSLTESRGDNLYQCDLTPNWGTYWATISSAQTVQVDVTSPCQTHLIHITPGTPVAALDVSVAFGYGMDYGDRYGGEAQAAAVVALYDQFRNLLAFGDSNGVLTWSGDPQSSLILAVTAPNYQELGSLGVDLEF